MLITNQTGTIQGYFPLNDIFLLKSQQIHKEPMQLFIERYDKYLYSMFNHKRFKLIHFNEMTILLTYGALR
ncbi:MAG: hypothetical protein HUJ61_01755 [Bacilli bacterium]|nr:hypothetical protein [Bacilli bacterium]